MHYIIGGAGNAPENVIEVGLKDIKEGGTYHYLWTGKPTAGQARVLDWLIDHNVPFIVYSENGKISPAVKQAAKDFRLIGNLLDVLDLYPEGHVLVLFDTDENGEPTQFTQRLVFGGAERGMVVLELTNGLVPLRVEDEGTANAKSPSEPSRSLQDASKSGAPTQVATKPKTALKTLVKTVTVKTYSDGSVEVVES